MYGSDIMGITELELDNPDYEKDVEFNYGYDDQLIEKKNSDYWMRKRLENYWPNAKVVTVRTQIIVFVLRLDV